VIWTGAVDTLGHARIHYLGKGYRVHRLIYMLNHRLETLPDDFKLKKICGRWGCIKSEHFRQYKSRPMTSPRCKYGHEFTPANTYVYKKGSRPSRACLACSRARRKGIDPRLEPVRTEKRPHGVDGYCARGHNLRLPLPNANIYVLPSGERRCKICRRRKERNAYASNKEAPSVH